MSEITKGLRARMTERAVRRSFKAAGKPLTRSGEKVELNFKPVAQRTTPLEGPGSARSYMSGTAMTTRDDAARRQVGKSAFGVDEPLSKAAKKCPHCGQSMPEKC